MILVLFKTKQWFNLKKKSMKIYSNAFHHEDFIPDQYTCKGEDINPPLIWEDAPEGTQSFALSLKDPDAPMGTFVHWMVYNIDKNHTEVKENSIPGDQVENHFGRKNYGGPCPPSGVHRYYFKIYALDVEKIENIESMKEFDEIMDKHVLEEAEIMGKYEK